MRAEDVKKGTRVQDVSVSSKRFGTLQSNLLILQGNETVNVLFDDNPFEENRLIIQLAKVD